MAIIWAAAVDIFSSDFGSQATRECLSQGAANCAFSFREDRVWKLAEVKTGDLCCA